MAAPGYYPPPPPGMVYLTAPAPAAGPGGAQPPGYAYAPQAPGYAYAPQAPPLPPKASVADRVINMGAQGMDMADRVTEMSSYGTKAAEVAETGAEVGAIGAEAAEGAEAVGFVGMIMASPEILFGLAVLGIFLLMWWWNGTWMPWHWWPVSYITGDASHSAGLLHVWPLSILTGDGFAVGYGHAVSDLYHTAESSDPCAALCDSYPAGMSHTDCVHSCRTGRPKGPAAALRDTGFHPGIRNERKWM